LKNQIDITKQRLREALVSGTDTAKLRAELGRFAAEEKRIVASRAGAVKHARRAADVDLDAEAKRWVSDASKRREVLVERLKIKELK